MSADTRPNDETCWSIVIGAADGDIDRRREFARTYLPIVRAYLGARWRGSGYIQSLEDAVQDVFVDCFKDGGALGRADPTRGARFRTFLFGVVRNVALRHEERRHKGREHQPDSGFHAHVQADDDALSVVFDRAWARALLRRAAERQRSDAEARPDDQRDAALRRVELLRLRFQEGLPIRDIATRWDMDAAVLHRQYRTAREEFQRALLDEVRFHSSGTQTEVERECRALLDLLG